MSALAVTDTKSPSAFAAAPVQFTGSDGAFRRLVVRGALLELVTFGFYRFWLTTDIRRHLWTHTEIDGDFGRIQRSMATRWNIPAAARNC